jgi:stage II sporulation protein P
MEQKAIQVGAAVLTLALLLRLGSAWENGRKELGRTLIFFSSGRLVTETMPAQTQPVPTEPVEETAAPVFGSHEEDFVRVNASWEVDTLSLLRQPLNWQLKGELPTVLILHTHGTESYEADGTYEETSPYRTLDTDHNMVSVGDRVADLLEAGGIRVIHDRSLHDYPAYNDAYANSRQAASKILEENPSICLVLDLHRDAAEDENGNQKRSAVTVEGESCARLMMVMGSDKGNLSFPQWEQNLALAVKLQACLEQKYEGLCKPIQLVTSRYNQDLSTGALLIEVGTAGNTHREALAAAEYLAEGILALSGGANLS